MLPTNDPILKEIVRRIEILERDVKALRSQQLFSTPGSSGTNLSLALNLDAGGNNGNTLVDRFEVGALNNPSSPISQMRVTIQAGNAEGVIITNAYLGHAAGTGDLYDFLATPVQLTWGGATTKTITLGTSAVSDWASFSYNKANALLVAMYTNGGAAADTFRYITGVASVTYYFKAATNEAGTVDKSAGYTANAGQVVGVNKIESNGF